jgi:hypothetical protein
MGSVVSSYFISSQGVYGFLPLRARIIFLIEYKLVEKVERLKSLHSFENTQEHFV